MYKIRSINIFYVTEVMKGLLVKLVLCNWPQ